MIRTDTTLDLSQKAEKGEGRKRNRKKEGELRTASEASIEASKKKTPRNGFFASLRGKYWDIVGLAELKVRRGIAKQSQERPGRPGESHL